MSFLNNGFMDKLNKLGNMILISMLWFVCSLPLITLIPATIALYYTVVKVVRRECGYPFQDYFHALKDNLRQGLILSVGYVAAGILLYTFYDVARAVGWGTLYGRLYLSVIILFTVVIVLFSFYLLPVLSRFQMKLTAAIRLSLYFTSGNLLTVIPLILTGVGALVLLYMIPPLMLVIPAAYACLMSISVEKALIRYTKEHLPEVAQEHMWYMDSELEE